MQGTRGVQAIGNDAFFGSWSCRNAFMCLLRTCLSEKGAWYNFFLTWFFFYSSHSLTLRRFLLFLFFSFGFSSFIFSFWFHLFNLGFRLLFALSFRIKWKVCICFTQMEGWCTNKALLTNKLFVGEFSLILFFCFVLFCFAFFAFLLCSLR